MKRFISKLKKATGANITQTIDTNITQNTDIATLKIFPAQIPKEWNKLPPTVPGHPSYNPGAAGYCTVTFQILDYRPETQIIMMGPLNGRYLHGESVFYHEGKRLRLIIEMQSHHVNKRGRWVFDNRLTVSTCNLCWEDEVRTNAASGKRCLVPVKPMTSKWWPGQFWIVAGRHEGGTVGAEETHSPVNIRLGRVRKGRYMYEFRDIGDPEVDEER